MQKKQAERKRADRFMHLDGISSQQAEIIRVFYDEGDIMMEAKDVAGMFKVSRITAKSYLDGLVRKGLLRKIQPDGRSHGYIRSDEFDTIIKSL